MRTWFEYRMDRIGATMIPMKLPEEPWTPKAGDRYGVYVKRVRFGVVQQELVYSASVKTWCIIKARSLKRRGWSASWGALKFDAPK